MGLCTSNLYGKIAVTDEAIRTVAAATALESYGIYGLGGWAHDYKGSQRVSPKRFKHAVRIDTKDNRIYVELNVILRYGVSIDAVTDSVRSAVKYNLENFTGMAVECININVLGIRN